MVKDVEISLDIINHKRTLDLEFRNLCYVVNDKCNKEKKFLINNVSGIFQAGRFTGVLGPSGAGKSSLLNVLSGFKKNGVSGSILVNNELMNRRRFRQNSAYISQDTNMHPNLSATESLTFATELKLSSDIKICDRSRIVTDVIKLLGLNKCSNTMASNLSGGERKRLSIGLELVTNPDIMFFDEPTSGLDSVAATQVMRYLRELAMSGRNIICVIHQPTSSLLQLFDDIYVLSEGCCIFRGPSSDMIPALHRFGFNCPNFYNPADFALEVASLKHEGNVVKLIETFKENEYEMFHERNISNEKAPMIDSPVEYEMSSESSNKQYAISEWRQFYVLTRRNILCTLRDLHLTKLRILLHILVAFLLGLVFYDVGNDASKITSNSSCLFFFLLFIFFANSMPVVLTFPLETAVSVREHLNNWYSLKAYYFSKLVADFPLMMIGPTCFVLIAFYMTSQPLEICRLLMFWGICFLTGWLSQVTGLLSGSVFSIEMSVLIVPATAIPMLMFSGFFIRFRELFGFLQPITYISYFRYGFEGAIHAIYGFNREKIPCSESVCYFGSIEKFLKFIDFEENNYFMDVLGLFVWILILNVLLYIALKIRLKRAQ